MNTMLLSIFMSLLSIVNSYDKNEDNSKNEIQYEANNNLGIKIFTKIVEKEDSNKNIMFSPISLNIALMMLYNGADGNTADEIAKALEIKGVSIDELNKLYKNLIKNILNQDKKVDINLANAAWFKENSKILTSYKRALKENYDAEINTAQFNQQTVNDINNWVKNKTNNKIDKIINEFTPDDVFVLLNAIYFNAKWQFEFDPKLTQDMDFYLTNKDIINTKAMFTNRGITLLNYDNNYNAVELQYGEGNFVIDLFMPTSNYSIEKLQKKLPDVLKTLDKRANKSNEINLYLPKFEYNYEISLVDYLKDLGITEVFTDDSDLSKISGIPTKVSKVLQKTFIKVNEEGTEAAAVTSITGVAITSIAKPKEIITIKFDHPFLYIIRDKNTNTILFIGKVVNPTINQ